MKSPPTKLPQPVFSVFYASMNGDSLAQIPKRGDTVQLKITFTLAEDVHLYGIKSSCSEFDGPIRAMLSADLNSGFDMIGVFSDTKDSMTSSSEFGCATVEYQNAGAFYCTIVIKDVVPSSKLFLYGQICSNKSGVCEMLNTTLFVPPLAL